MNKPKLSFVALALTAATAATSSALAGPQSVTAGAGKYDRVNVPVTVAIEVPSEHAKTQVVALRGPGDQTLLGQLTSPGLGSDAQGELARELHFLVPQLSAGESRTWKIDFDAEVASSKSFEWKDTPGKYMTLLLGGEPVLRYMYEALDESSAARREETYKVFHHVFDPEGDEVVTKGPGGRYTHHRGLFYGFNRINYDGKRADIWHARGAHQGHMELVSSEAGPVLGRHAVKIGWYGKDKDLFALELRQMTVFNKPGGHLIEFTSRLSPAAGVKKIVLDGDPQHAGFQFRASNEVAAKTSKQTIYIRPDGEGKPGGTRNWPGDKQHANLRWNAQSFVLGDTRYTAAYLDHPQNPKEARYSERNYGRFGSYFEYTLEGSNAVLPLNYRVWVQREKMDVDGVAALHRNFVDPPKVAVKK